MAGSGGAWKVAYADFVTAMMAFFMVMWLVGQNKPVKEAVAKYFADPGGKADSPAGSPKNKFRSDLHPGGSKMMQQGAGKRGSIANETQAIIDGKETPNGSEGVSRVQPMLPSTLQRSSMGVTIFFDEFSIKLDDKNERLLTLFLPQLQGKTNKIELRGHSTRRPLPPEVAKQHENVWRLSFARSQTIMKLLIDNGIDIKRIRLSQAAGFEPVVKQTDSVNIAENARVEIYLLNECVDDAAVSAKENEDSKSKSKANNQKDKPNDRQADMQTPKY